jgi:hypothetical protein
MKNRKKLKYICKIWDFRVGDYEECRFLGCGAVQILCERSCVFSTGGSVCRHLLTLLPRSGIFSWRWRRYVPTKRRLTQDLQGATSQKTALWNIHKFVMKDTPGSSILLWRIPCGVKLPVYIMILRNCGSYSVESISRAIEKELRKMWK